MRILGYLVIITGVTPCALLLQVSAIPGVTVMNISTISPESRRLCSVMDPWKLAIRVDGLTGGLLVWFGRALGRDFHTPTDVRHQEILHRAG